jgi:hypothetical protein
LAALLFVQDVMGRAISQTAERNRRRTHRTEREPDTQPIGAFDRADQAKKVACEDFATPRAEFDQRELTLQ